MLQASAATISHHQSLHEVAKHTLILQCCIGLSLFLAGGSIMEVKIATWSFLPRFWLWSHSSSRRGLARKHAQLSDKVQSIMLKCLSLLFNGLILFFKAIVSWGRKQNFPKIKDFILSFSTSTYDSWEPPVLFRIWDHQKPNIPHAFNHLIRHLRVSNFS